LKRYWKVYKTYFTPEFSEQAKKYGHLKKVLANKIKLLSVNPYTNCKSELLVGELKGLRSARITKSFRVIFSVCEECRARKFQKFVGCSLSICEKMDSKTMVFLTFGPHDEVYS
jgi:mRNA-degrading endonuclease YafQ of YafQ-DinJ toxin-antitoxin module